MDLHGNANYAEMQGMQVPQVLPLAALSLSENLKGGRRLESLNLSPAQDLGVQHPEICSFQSWQSLLNLSSLCGICIERVRV